MTSTALLFAATASVGAATVAVATPISASPTTALSAQQAGLPTSLSFSEPNATQQITVPVPAGLTLGSLVGTINPPVTNYPSALVVSSDSTTGVPTVLGVVSIPAAQPSTATIPFSVSIAGATVVNGSALLTLTYRSNTQNPTYVCDQVQPLTITGLSVQYAGASVAPTSVATFLPPVLQTLDIYVPANPDLAVQQAAVDIALLTVRRYAPQPVSVVLHTWNQSGPLPGVPSETFERTVLVRTSPAAGSAVETDGAGGSVLVFRGTGSALDNQTVVLSGAPNAGAQGTSANVSSVGAVASVNSLRQSFSQLGASGTVTGVGDMSFSVGLAEAKLGGVLSSMNVHLIAHYTPVQSQERASAVISVAGKVLSTQTLDGSGEFTTNVDIPQELISRVTTLNFAVNYNPEGDCATSGRTLTFSVDPQSFVTASLASGGTGGFDALGQAFLPTYNIGLGTGDVSTELDTAVQLSDAMQQVTGVALTAKVTPLSTVLNNSIPAMIVAPASQVPTSLDPPFALTGRTNSLINGPNGTAVSTNAAIATLQAFAQTEKSRTILLATTTSTWDTFEPIQTLVTGPLAWGSLTGDTLVAGPSGQVSELTIRAGGSTVTLYAGSTGLSLITIGIIASAIVVVILLIAIAALARRRNRRSDRAKA